MCEICRQHPCANTCPNADQPEVIGTCAYCEEEICEDEAYYTVTADGRHYHYDCLFNVAEQMLIEAGIVELEGDPN